jgi:hypothetical protein
MHSACDVRLHLPLANAIGSYGETPYSPHRDE